MVVVGQVTNLFCCPRDLKIWQVAVAEGCSCVNAGDLRECGGGLEPFCDPDMFGGKLRRPKSTPVVADHHFDRILGCVRVEEYPLNGNKRL